MYGVLSDAYGRRPAFQLATGMVLAFGMLTAAAPSFYWLVLCRMLVGAGASGMTVPYDLLGEVVPREEKSR